MFRYRVVLVWTPLLYLLSLHVLHAPRLLGAWRARRGHDAGCPVGLRLCRRSVAG